MNILVSMPVGVVKDTFITPDIKQQIEALGNVEWNNTDKHFTVDELREKLKNVDICISGWGHPRYDKDMLEGNNRLKLIAHTGGSVAPVVSDYMYEKGIRITCGNPVFAESVAESVVAYALCALRDIPHYNNVMQNGGWKTPDYYIEGLLDQTVGLVSFGMIAQYVVGLLKPFRPNIKVYSNHLSEETCAEYGIKKASLDEIFSTCKIISIHTAKRPDTYHMVDRRLLQMIQDGGLLINTARGSVIDEEAMAEELQSGRFKAVLDVYEQEPLPAGSKLRGLKNVVLIPHMGGPTIDRRRYVTISLIEDIKRYMEGKELKSEISQSYAKFMTT